MGTVAAPGADHSAWPTAVGCTWEVWMFLSNGT
jgi:hypothetical protein